jgi:hypothetical protein
MTGHNGTIPLLKYPNTKTFSKKLSLQIDIGISNYIKINNSRNENQSEL